MGDGVRERGPDSVHVLLRGPVSVRGFEKEGRSEWVMERGRVGDGETEGRREGVSGSGRGSDGESGRESEHSTPNTKNSKLSLSKKYSFHSTKDIINACKSGKLPDQIMMNFHPQRWTDHPVKWAQELVWQNAKNVVKGGIVFSRRYSGSRGVAEPLIF